jgi:hypothetical protein
VAESPESFESWAILELMGHVRMAGRVTEEERFGSKMGRIDVPQGDSFVSVYFTAGSIYRMTACSEEVARAVAAQNRVKPVHQYELPKPEPEPEEEDDEEEDPRVTSDPRPGYDYGY